jgi:probable selenium-dependent hydroxylase accessory protein YqeC
MTIRGEALLELFNARRGMVCAVGAGGKKSTLYALADAHPGRHAITTTVFMAQFPDDLDGEIVVEGPGTLAERVRTAGARRVAYACPGDKAGRHGAVPPELVRRLHDECGFETTFVKADGARMRWIKAPRDDEPVLPPGPLACVIPVLSARVLGEPLSERIAHRLDRVMAVTGLREGETIGPAHLAALLTHPEGVLKGGGNAPVVPVFNMVDDPERAAAARQAAELALAHTDRFARVVLATMRRIGDPIVEVVGEAP